MSARNILAACIRSREAYERVGALLSGVLGPQEEVILHSIGTYYDRDPNAEACDPSIVSEAVCRTLPNPKHQTTFKALIQSLWDANVSAANVVADFIETKRQAAGSRLATSLAAGKSADEVRKVLDEYLEWQDRALIEESPALQSAVGKSVLELVKSRTAEGGLLRVVPASLNERLGGGLLRGHHVIVFARPEVGKTMVLINMACGFARQGLKVVYISNEDPLDDIVLRGVCRLADMTRAEIIESPAEAEQRAAAAGYSNIVFCELAPGTPREVELLVEEHKPDVVVLDQLRNLNVGEDNFVRALEKAASSVRNIGKRHNCLVVSATQAGDSASGKSVLDMGDVDNSNTGIPAQADVLLGVGMSSDDESRGTRMFSLCKNKPGGNHDYFPVIVEPAKSKVRS